MGVIAMKLDRPIPAPAEPDFVLEALRNLPDAADGRDIVPDVLAAVRRIEARDRFFRPLRRYGIAAALALLAGGVVALQSGWGRASAGASAAPAAIAGARDILTPADGARWLLEHQRPGGGWDTSVLGGRPEHRPALTALGLLALHRQDPDGNREAVLQGAEALCAMQGADGSFGPHGAVRLNQGLVSAVLLELNQTLRSPKVGASLSQALSYARRTVAMGDGSWGYSRSGEVGPHDGALFAAASGALRAPELRQALEGGLQALPRLAPTAAEQSRFYDSCIAALGIAR